MNKGAERHGDLHTLALRARAVTANGMVRSGHLAPTLRLSFSPCVSLPMLQTIPLAGASDGHRVPIFIQVLRMILVLYILLESLSNIPKSPPTEAACSRDPTAFRPLTFHFTIWASLGSSGF